MTFRSTFAALLLCLGLAARAEDLSPEQVAKVRMEEQDALDKVNAAHGNKKASEMDAEERRQVIQEQRKASQEALERNGVSAKDYARATMDAGKREQVEAASRTLKEKREAEKKAAAAKDSKAAGQVVVEHGIPKDVQDEMGGAPGGGSRRGGGKSYSSGSRRKSGSKHSRKHPQDD